jgi:protein-tyrosine-phosphatase
VGPGEAEHLAVPDPFGGDETVYEETYRTLERYVRSALNRMRKEMGR